MKYQRLTQLHGISENRAAKITRHLGEGSEETALRRIENNPYQLIDVPGIGFKIADRIALQNYQVDPTSENRHTAANQYLLEQDGSVPERDWGFKRKGLGLDPEFHKFLGVETDSGRVWLKTVLNAEIRFAEWIREIGLPRGSSTPQNIKRPTEAEESKLAGLDLTQQTAALLAIHSREVLQVITGGAGTGKTHVISAIARLCRLHGLQLAVAAFAGKAADRVREALEKAETSAGFTGTIHKLLGIKKEGFFFEVQLPFDIIILDEASMIDLRLVWAVINSLKPGAKIILVGDDGQLPPVGYGQPFKDLISLNAPRTHLEKNYRQQDQQGILHLAEAIRNRKTLNVFDPSVNLQVHEDLSTQINSHIESMAGRNLLDWQLICYKNDDCEEFNIEVQNTLNTTGWPAFSYWGKAKGNRITVLTGSKVMVKQNDYDLEVFNGQLGIVQDVQEVEITTVKKAEDLQDWAVADEQGNVTTTRTVTCVQVLIHGRVVNVPVEDAEELLRLGYCITVHKAQGSDWDEVIILQTSPVSYDALKWWYTACTRAKNKLSIYYCMKTPAQYPLSPFWANAHRTVPDAPTTLRGRVMKLHAQRSMVTAHQTTTDWLR